MDYKEWLEGLENLNDIEIAERVRDMIISKKELDPVSERLFRELFDYLAGMAEKGETITMSDVEVHVKSLGYDTNQINLPVLFMLLSFCGLFITDNC